LINFVILILLGGPIVELVTGAGGEGWWMLQDILPYRSETLIDIFFRLTYFEPRPTVSPAQQLAFEEFLNEKP
jgi:hypothetical protein